MAEKLDYLGKLYERLHKLCDEKNYCPCDVCGGEYFEPDMVKIAGLGDKVCRHCDDEYEKQLREKRIKEALNVNKRRTKKENIHSNKQTGR